MQWLIVPAVLAALAFFNIFPSMPGFAYIILAAVYLMVAVIEKRLIDMQTAAAQRHLAVMEKLEIMELHIEQKIEGVEQEVSDLKYEIKMK